MEKKFKVIIVTVVKLVIPVIIITDGGRHDLHRDRGVSSAALKHGFAPDAQ